MCLVQCDNYIYIYVLYRIPMTYFPPMNKEQISQRLSVFVLQSTVMLLVCTLIAVILSAIFVLDKTQLCMSKCPWERHWTLNWSWWLFYQSFCACICVCVFMRVREWVHLAGNGEHSVGSVTYTVAGPLGSPLRIHAHPSRQTPIDSVLNRS